MRISLKLMLKYVNEQLDQETKGKLEQEMKERPKLTQLAERLNRVTRRRRLSTPDEIDLENLPDEYRDNPNAVAAYLDEEMTFEEESQMEGICVDHDEYLAEVASCHQVMTKPPAMIKIGPLARQRMLRLVSGPESQPLRLAASATSEKRDISRKLDQARWARRKWLIPAAALLVGAAVLGLAKMLNPTETPVVLEPLPAVVPEANPVPEPVKDPANPAWKAIASWPMPATLSEMQPVWESAPQIIGSIGAWLSHPALPPNMIWPSHPPETKPEIAVETPAEPAVPPAANLTPDLASKVPVGWFAGENGSMLIREIAPATFRFLQAQENSVSNERLISLPGFRNSLEMVNGIRLTLIGQIPSSGNSYAESMVQVHPAGLCDMDITLHRGRGTILAQKQTKIRIRFADSLWETELLAGTELAYQVNGRVQPGDGPWNLVHRMDLIVHQGRAQFTRNQKVLDIGKGEQLSWSNRGEEAGPGIITTLKEIPGWINKSTTNHAELRDGLGALQKQVHGRLQNDMPEEKSLRLALEEALDDKRGWTRAATLASLTAIGHMTPIIRVMDQETAPMRKVAYDAVFNWLGHEDANVKLLQESLSQYGFSESASGLIMSLLRGPGKVSKATVESLLTHMSNKHLMIRELAWQNLASLFPEKPGVFDPAGDEDQRRKAIEQLKTKLLPLVKNATPVIQPAAGNVPLPP